MSQEKTENSDPLDKKPTQGWRHRLHEIIFEADTPAGKRFDVLLILSVILSVLVVMLDSVQEINETLGSLLNVLELVFTGLFTIEIGLRLLALKRPMKYFLSFFGVVDVLSVLPTYIGWFLPGASVLLSLRLLRVLRIFRVLKLGSYLKESRDLIQAFKASRRRIVVFLTAVIILVTIMGSLMYVIEPVESGFTNIPTGLYWGIVTLTTVGYGDISPITPLGQAISSIIMILGYSLIVVPTGLVSVAMVKPSKVSTQACPSCSKEGHDPDAKYCKFCGERL